MRRYISLLALIIQFKKNQTMTRGRVEGGLLSSLHFCKILVENDTSKNFYSFKNRESGPKHIYICGHVEIK